MDVRVVGNPSSGETFSHFLHLLQLDGAGQFHFPERPMVRVFIVVAEPVRACSKTTSFGLFQLE